MRISIQTTPAELASAAAGASLQGKTLLQAITESIAEQLRDYKNTHK